MVRLTYYPNTWTFPGGGVDKNEDSKDAVIRECKEEVGITLQNPEYLGDLSFNYENKKDTVSIYREYVSERDFKIDNKEIAEAQWFDMNKLPTMGNNAKTISEFSLKIAS